jgi:hypothetical protein
LIELVSDESLTVRRKALQSLMVGHQSVEFADLQKSLASKDRMEAWAARRLLEIQPIEEWENGVLESTDTRVFLQGSVAMMVSHPTRSGAKKIIAQIRQRLPQYLSDADFLALLRVVQIAIHRGGLERADIPEFAKDITNEFPSGDSKMNRELIRILARLQAGEISDRYVAYVTNPEIDKLDRLHVAIHLRFIEEGWNSSARMQVVEFMESAQNWEENGSYGNYLRSVTRDFVKAFPAEDRNQVLAQADQWPAAGLGALYGLEEQLDGATRATLIDLDGRVKPSDATAVKALRVGIVAVLARSGDEESMAYLRDIWTTDSERRTAITMGLAQKPDGKNWDYLVRSLGVTKGPIAEEILRKLATVPLKPTEAEPYRQTIEMAFRGDIDSDSADALLAHWSQQSTRGEGESISAAMNRWQAWYKQNYPEAQPPNIARGTNSESR